MVTRFLLMVCAVIPCLSFSWIAYGKGYGGWVLFGLVAALFSMAVVGWYYRSPSKTLAEFMATPAAATHHVVGYMMRSTHQDVLFWGMAGWFFTSVFLMLFSKVVGTISLLLVVSWGYAIHRAMKKREWWTYHDGPSFPNETEQLEDFPFCCEV